MRPIPRPGEIYKHFKGNCYRIVTLAEHTETRETLVIYQALYGTNEIYARELSMFMSPVDRVKYPDVQQEMRFELLGDILAESGALKEERTQESGTGNDAVGGQNPEINEQKAEKEIPGLDPMLLAYLDADSSKERLQILTSMRDRLTDKMINTMAIAIDVEIKPGDITERYEELKYCLATRERFETRRLR